MKVSLNINCDLGEGIGNDAEIMPYLSSCNIACGGHYGDADSIRKTIHLAQEFDVKIGAHPSFPDRKNFGRKLLQMDSKALINCLVDQIHLFEKVAHEEGEEMHHIKLHGALYNLAATDTETAKTVISALKIVGNATKIYTPFQSKLAKAAQSNFEIVPEAFIDRTYQSDLSLTPRTSDNALISDPEKAWQQLSEIFSHKKVQCIKGIYKPIQAETYCIHGDSPYALKTLQFIHEKLGHD